MSPTSDRPGDAEDSTTTAPHSLIVYLSSAFTDEVRDGKVDFFIEHGGSWSPTSLSAEEEIKINEKLVYLVDAPQSHAVGLLREVTSAVLRFCKLLGAKIDGKIVCNLFAYMRSMWDHGDHHNSGTSTGFCCDIRICCDKNIPISTMRKHWGDLLDGDTKPSPLRSWTAKFARSGGKLKLVMKSEGVSLEANTDLTILRLQLPLVIFDKESATIVTGTRRRSRIDRGGDEIGSNSKGVSPRGSDDSSKDTTIRHATGAAASTSGSASVSARSRLSESSQRSSNDGGTSGLLSSIMAAMSSVVGAAGKQMHHASKTAGAAEKLAGAGGGMILGDFMTSRSASLPARDDDSKANMGNERMRLALSEGASLIEYCHRGGGDGRGGGGRDSNNDSCASSGDGGILSALIGGDSSSSGTGTAAQTSYDEYSRISSKATTPNYAILKHLTNSTATTTGQSSSSPSPLSLSSAFLHQSFSASSGSGSFSIGNSFCRSHAATPSSAAASAVSASTAAASAAATSFIAPAVGESSTSASSSAAATTTGHHVSSVLSSALSSSVFCLHTSPLLLRIDPIMSTNTGGGGGGNLSPEQGVAVAAGGGAGAATVGAAAIPPPLDQYEDSWGSRSWSSSSSKRRSGSMSETVVTSIRGAIRTFSFSHHSPASAHVQPEEPQPQPQPQGSEQEAGAGGGGAGGGGGGGVISNNSSTSSAAAAAANRPHQHRQQLSSYVSLSPSATTHLVHHITSPAVLAARISPGDDSSPEAAPATTTIAAAATGSDEQQQYAEEASTSPNTTPTQIILEGVVRIISGRGRHHGSVTPSPVPSGRTSPVHRPSSPTTNDDYHYHHLMVVPRQPHHDLDVAHNTTFSSSSASASTASASSHNHHQQHPHQPRQYHDHPSQEHAPHRFSFSWGMMKGVVGGPTTISPSTMADRTVVAVPPASWEDDDDYDSDDDDDDDGYDPVAAELGPNWSSLHRRYSKRKGSRGGGGGSNSAKTKKGFLGAISHLSAVFEGGEEEEVLKSSVIVDEQEDDGDGYGYGAAIAAGGGGGGGGGKGAAHLDREASARLRPTFLDELEYRMKLLAEHSEVSDTEKRSRHFLIVDDDPVGRKVVRRMLIREGQLVTEAVDGLDCITQFETASSLGNHFDVILMDNEMPTVNGEDIVRRLRDRGCMVPIFGLTGHTRSDEIKSFMSHGVDAVLPKPLKIVDLVAELEKFSLRKQRQESESSKPSSSSPPDSSKTSTSPPDKPSVSCGIPPVATSTASGITATTAASSSADAILADLIAAQEEVDNNSNSNNNSTSNSSSVILAPCSLSDNKDDQHSSGTARYGDDGRNGPQSRRRMSSQAEQSALDA